MALQVGELHARLGLDSSTFIQKLGLSKAALLGIVGTAAVVGIALKTAFDIGAEIDEARDIIRVGTGAMGEDLQGLLDTALAVTEQVPISVADAANLIADLNTRLGVSGDEAEDLAVRMGNLARIMDQDVSNVVAEQTRLFGDWGVPADKMGETLDFLFRTSQTTGIGMDRLSTLTTDYGATMRGLGLTLEEGASLMGKWEQEGVNTEAVLAGMKIGLNNLARDAAEAREQLEGMPPAQQALSGIRLEEPADAFRRVAEEIKNASSNTEAFAIAADTFGTRAGADMAMAIREGRFETEELVAMLGEGSETINAAAQDTFSLGEKWELFSNRITNRIAPVMLAFYDMLGNALDAVLPIIEGAIDFISGLFSGFGATANEEGSKVNEIVSQIGVIVSQVFEIVREHLQAAQEFWAEWGDEIMAVLGVVFDVLTTVFSTALNTVIGILEIFIGIFTGDWERAWEGVKSIFDGVIEGIKDIFRRMWTAIGNTVTEKKDEFLGKVGEVWDNVTGAVEDAIEDVKTFFGDLWSDLTEGAGEKAIEFLNWWTDLPSKILAALGDLGSILLDAGKQIMDGLWSGLKEKWESVSGWLSGIGGAIKDLKGPIDKDRVLLTGEGAAIIDGLHAGMVSRFPKIVDALGGLTSQIGNTSLSGAIRSPEGATGRGTQTLILQLDRREIARTVIETDYEETTVRLGASNRY